MSFSLNRYIFYHQLGGLPKSPKTGVGNLTVVRFQILSVSNHLAMHNHTTPHRCFAQTYSSLPMILRKSSSAKSPSGCSSCTFSVEKGEICDKSVVSFRGGSNSSHFQVNLKRDMHACIQSYSGIKKTGIRSLAVVS